jgi:hypothetical protein
MRRALAAAALATVAGADLVIHRRRPRWIVVGLLDWPAHLATAGLVALNLPPLSRAWHAGFLAGALLPDADHVPLALAEEHPGPEARRPATHCPAAIAPLFALASAARSEALSGAAWGAAAHLARDLAVGNGVALLRPLRGHDLRLPYPVYAAGLTVLAARVLARTR